MTLHILGLVTVMFLSPLTLQMPDASDMKHEEYEAVLQLRPRALLVMLYAQWPNDKGASQQYRELASVLGHRDMYVRFHADPNPIVYARKHGGPEAWGRLCADQMTRYYGDMPSMGIQLHAILANEYDAPQEGGLGAQEASVWLAAAMRGYGQVRPQDKLHVPATTGSPFTLHHYLYQYKVDGWVQPEYVIDGHAYGGDLRDVLAVMEYLYPDNAHMLSEVNNTPLTDAAKLVGRASAVSYFTLNWAHGGEGRLRMTDMDRAQHISLLRWRDKFDEFIGTIGEDNAN